MANYDRVGYSKKPFVNVDGGELGVFAVHNFLRTQSHGIELRN